MSTFKQREAAKILSENVGKPLGQIMREVGYSEITSLTPQRLTDSVGFKEACEQFGLTNELILSALTEDIKNKKGNRKGELELGAKIKGMLVERSENKNTNLNISLSDLFERTREN